MQYHVKWTGPLNEPVRQQIAIKASAFPSSNRGPMFLTRPAFRRVELLVLLFCAFIVRRAGAQDLSQAVDQYVREAMDFRHIPGLALAVIRDGVPVHVKEYGYADVENRVPVTPETVFQSGSIGKQFTAAAILQLRAEGKLTLEDPVSRHLAGTPNAWKDITIYHLLTHTSGIPDFPEDTSTGVFLQRDYTEGDFLRIAVGLPLRFPPGKGWDYSNTGYLLLGLVIHSITGAFYGEKLERDIFGPLGMTTAQVINEADIIPNRSRGYELHEGEWKNQRWNSPSINSTADGSIYLTLRDLILWDQALTRRRILDSADLALMTTPVRILEDSVYPYGMAWELSSFNGHPAHWHSGSWQGYNSFILRLPEDRLTVIVLTNLHPCNPKFIARDVALLYLPDAAPPPHKSPRKVDKDMMALVSDFLKDPTTVDRSHPLLSVYAPERLDATLRQLADLKSTFGPVSQIIPLEPDPALGTHAYMASFKVGAQLITVQTDPKGRITDMSIFRQ